MDVVIDRSAQKQLRRVPRQIIRQLRDWVADVLAAGLPAVMKQPGYHDEPLAGKRQGQRSIRLSRLWRAIYLRAADRLVIHEVTPHDYRAHAAADVEALPFLNHLLGEDEPTAAMDDKTLAAIAKTLCGKGRRDLARQLVRASRLARGSDPC